LKSEFSVLLFSFSRLFLHAFRCHRHPADNKRRVAPSRSAKTLTPGKNLTLVSSLPQAKMSEAAAAKLLQQQFKSTYSSLAALSFVLAHRCSLCFLALIDGFALHALLLQ
jgi:pyruvate/2-oxoglutarate/acetoin dehydrogenase E1 component